MLDLKRTGIASGIATLALSGMSHAALIENLSQSVSGAGLLPNVSLSSGSLTGLYDGTAYQWNSSVSSGPRVFTASSPATLQPYLTWATPQQISSVRVWSDTNWQLPNYDRLAVDVLKAGGNPIVEADWVQKYDSGTGINAFYRDISLGGNVTTSAVRVRAYTISKTSSQGLNVWPDYRVGVGEIAVFGAASKDGLSRMTDVRVIPSSATASSQQWGDRPPSQVTDGVWQDNYWRSTIDTSNPGNDYLLDLNFANATMNGASVTFMSAAGPAPTSWQLQYDNGNGFVTLGTYTLDGARRTYYYDFGQYLTGVQKLRLVVPESAATAGIALAEFEAFNVVVPEPATLGLIPIAGMILARRRR